MGRLTLVQLAYNGSQFENNAAETVLDALIRQGVDVSYSCKNGFFHSCMLRAEDGEIPQNAQQGLRSSHCDEGFFLPCVCHPISDMALAPPGLNGEFRTAEVVSINPLNSSICRVSLRPEIELRHRAGQFINFRRADGLMRSYSLCNQPDNEILELHVKRMPGGELSNWIIDELQPGAKISIQGPNGGFYLPENAIDKPILFIGPGSGLGALAAVVLDALGRGFTAPMRLYHGTSAGKGLYLRSAMANLAEANSNFRYVPCVSGIDVPKFVARAEPTISRWTTIPIFAVGACFCAARREWFTIPKSEPIWPAPPSTIFSLIPTNTERRPRRSITNCPCRGVYATARLDLSTSRVIGSAPDPTRGGMGHPPKFVSFLW